MPRCVFLDRDGVINVKPPAGDYVRSWEAFRLIPTMVDWIRLFNALGLLVIVVINQRGVARGLMSQSDLDRIHEVMLERLAVAGARIDDIFCCIHAEGTCDCRKPRPGMVLEAASKWNIDLKTSILIGDSPVDRRLAQACNLKFVAVDEGRITKVVG